MTETLTETSPLTLTDSAILQLKKIKTEQNVPDNHALRVGVKGGGCSGFSYVLGFDVATDSDLKFELNGVAVLLDKAHALYLMGIEIDWVEGLNNRGFSFNNPNAKSTCGCGSSFAA